MEEQEIAQSHIVPCNDIESQDWYAWINKMPPTPNALYVTGEVLVSNPGVDPILVPKQPQGINPKILLLNLFLHQKPGVWPRVMTWKPVRYEKVGNTNYTNVEVFCGDTAIAKMEVEEVQ